MNKLRRRSGLARKVWNEMVTEVERLVEVCEPFVALSEEASSMLLTKYWGRGESQLKARNNKDHPQILMILGELTTEIINANKACQARLDKPVTVPSSYTTQATHRRQARLMNRLYKLGVPNVGIANLIIENPETSDAGRMEATIELTRDSNIGQLSLTGFISAIYRDLRARATTGTIETLDFCYGDCWYEICLADPTAEQLWREYAVIAPRGWIHKVVLAFGNDYDDFCYGDEI